MSKPDKPDGSLNSEEAAGLRALRRIAAALEGDDVAELAAALGRAPDPAWPEPGSHRRPKQKSRFF